MRGERNELKRDVVRALERLARYEMTGRNRGATTGAAFVAMAAGMATLAWGNTRRKVDAEQSERTIVHGVAGPRGEVLRRGEEP